MGGRGSGSSFSVGSTGSTAAPKIQMQTNPPKTVATNVQAQQLNAMTFNDTDPADYHDLFNGSSYYQSQNLSIDQRIAVINYLSNVPEPGSMYSMSQNMNQAMASGQKLTANQDFTRDSLDSAMHNLGYNLNLTRYDHASFVDALLRQRGMTSSYDSLSEAQLKSALVGHTYHENKFLSTSYNDFKNAADPSTFTSRAVKIEYRAKASTKAMMPGNGPGGRLGEIVLGPTGGRDNSKIVDVKFSGKMARRQGTQSYTQKQVIIVVEVD